MSARPEDFLARLAPGCMWTVPSPPSIAGVYRGVDEIVGFFRRLQELSGGTYAVEPLWELGEGGRGVFYYRARGSRPDGRTIDLDQAAVYAAGPDGRFAEVHVLPFDQSVFDAFWS